MAESSSGRLPVCNICTEVVKQLGVMDCCDHVFCWSDISRWAQEQSTCPWCRKVFVSLSRIPLVQADYEMVSLTQVRFRSPAVPQEVLRVPPRIQASGPTDMTPEDLAAFLVDADVAFAHQTGEAAAQLEGEAIQDRIRKELEQQEERYRAVQRRRDALQRQVAGFLARRRLDMQRIGDERHLDRLYWSKDEQAKRKREAAAAEDQTERDRRRRRIAMDEKQTQRRTVSSLSDLNAKLLRRHADRNKGSRPPTPSQPHSPPPAEPSVSTTAHHTPPFPHFHGTPTGKHSDFCTRLTGD